MYDWNQRLECDVMDGWSNNSDVEAGDIDALASGCKQVTSHECETDIATT